MAYQGEQAPWYAVMIAITAIVLPLTSVISSGIHLGTMIITAIIVLIGLSIFFSLHSVQKLQPRTITVNEQGILTLNDSSTGYIIARTSRSTPWFIMLMLETASASRSRRIILWSSGMSLTDFRTMSRVVHYISAQPQRIRRL